MEWKPTKTRNSPDIFPAKPGSDQVELGGLVLYEREVEPDVYFSMLHHPNMFYMHPIFVMDGEENENKIYRWIRKNAMH